MRRNTKMRKYFAKLNSGFTMIELLIVIAVLGILAVAVISAINPIEQINRSKDTGSRSDAEQFIGGVDRFYTAKGYYPWQDNPTDGNENAAAWLNLSQTSDNVVNKVEENLSNSTSELKQSFRTRITQTNYNPLWIYNRGIQGNSTYVCFKPVSGAFQNEAWGRCASLPSDLDTVNALVCNSSTNVYSCLP